VQYEYILMALISTPKDQCLNPANFLPLHDVLRDAKGILQDLDYSMPTASITTTSSRRMY